LDALFLISHFDNKMMVAKGLCAAALALALASVSAFAPGTSFVNKNAASYGTDRIVNAEGSIVTPDKVCC
jgi:hypothetical protein